MSAAQVIARLLDGALKWRSGCGQVVGVARADGELLAAAARGDGAAFGCFYRRHEQRVVACAVGHCTGASDAADLVAETFLQALVPAGRFRSAGGGALPWLVGVSRHLLRRRIDQPGQRLFSSNARPKGYGVGRG